MNVLNEVSSKVIEKLLSRSPVFQFKKYRVEPDTNITLYRNPITSKIDHMNSVGTMIHQLSIQEYTIGQIIEHLQGAFTQESLPSKELLTRDVLLFCRSMECLGLLKWKIPQQTCRTPQ